jgi:protein-tyrosine phosphatase
MDLTPDPKVVSKLALGCDFQHFNCGHADHVSCSRVIDGQLSIICGACFALVVDEDQKVRSRSNPIQLNISCEMCGGSSSVRFNIDLGLGICDYCTDQNEQLSEKAERERTPRVDIFPDEIIPSLLYMGCKDSAYNLSGLLSRSIRRVLICCERLPAYHTHSTPLILYHRIPIADSLAQGLSSYLPSALAFIAQGVMLGEATLVHCNAGVSRSGAIVTEWIRQTVPSVGRSTDLAIEAGKQRRSWLHPNSNFVAQLKLMESEEKRNDELSIT